ncbi:MAG: NAD-dependent epimerase/dehydratase family protein [Candidatus Sungbacteria bacterium]|nr:NAD-dependent epimerase/dehydratase family protein [Candidatus Sungbacteria bacterium]
MKSIVTGGAGFIGSHMVDALVGRGDEVHIIDNFSTGKREYVNSGAVLHEKDIRDFDSIAPIFHGVSKVFHLAALARVQPSIKDPCTSHDVNSKGTTNVLVAARDAGVGRLVYSASSSAYGNQDTLPLHEEMEARPMSPYALQKYTGELSCRLFSQIYGIETVSLRYFNVYGPRQTTEADGVYATVIGIFLGQRASGRAMTVVPDGTQSRDFTHVRDVVRANLFAAESPNVGKGEVINIGTGKTYAINEVAAVIGGPTVWVEPRLEPKRTLVDITKAKELLGWEPTVDFKEGIEELKKMCGIVLVVSV